MRKIAELWNSCGFIFKAFLVITGFCALMSALANPLYFIAVPIVLVVSYFILSGFVKISDGVHQELEKAEKIKQRQKDKIIKDQKYLDGSIILDIGDDILEYFNEHHWKYLEENYGFQDVTKLFLNLAEIANKNSIYSPFIDNLKERHIATFGKPDVIVANIRYIYQEAVEEFMWQHGYDPYSKKDRVNVRDNFKEDLYYIKKAALEIYLKALYKDNKSVFIDQNFQYYIIEDQNGETRWFYFD